MAASRALIIGDVHGCAEELRILLERCEYQPGDSVVFVGDLVAKGPDSQGVVKMARSLSARTVLGNHDVRVLEIRQHLDKGEPPPRATKSHVTAAQSLSRDDVAWLRQKPFYLRLETYGVAVVHAGIVPGIPLEAQDPAQLTTLRSILPDGTPSPLATMGVPWASTWEGPECVVFGHDARRGLQRHPWAYGLDTGCVYGGELTALALPERRIISVSAKNVYLDRGKKEPLFP